MADFADVEKAKLQSKGKGVSGESRADVPLFELDTEGKHRYKSRNALYWLNCNENIDELEELKESWFMFLLQTIKLSMKWHRARSIIGIRYFFA